MSDVLKGNAVLFSEMTPPDGGEDRFNDWYDHHHTPSHVEGVPGFISALRYKSDEGPHYLAIYELESPETLETEEYRSRKFTPDAPTKAMLDSVSGFSRYIAVEQNVEVKGEIDDALDAEVMLAVLFKTPEDRLDEFDAWYKEEHLPHLMQADEWRMGRCMKIVDHNPEPFNRLFLHYVTDLRALASPVLKSSRETEWRLKLAGEPWFKPHLVTYRRRNNRFTKTQRGA